MRLPDLATLIVIGGIAAAGAALAAQAQSYRQLYAFPVRAHGANPYAALRAFHGKLFGTTSYGGSSNCGSGCGTIFSVDPATGRQRVVYAFQGAGDGNGPQAGLFPFGGLLYGTTRFGGIDQNGTVFSIDPGTGVKTIIHSFSDGDDGFGPASDFIEVAGLLYSVTLDGGPLNRGTIYSINPANDVETVVYSFQGGHDDGDGGVGALRDVDGLLYGVTAVGGVFGGGTLFSFDPATRVETVLHSFGGGEDGSAPSGGLTLVGGNLYGITASGGTYDQGTVFRLDLASGREEVAHSFAGKSDGRVTTGGLVDVHGTLYGTNYAGGDVGCDCGTIFSLVPSTNAVAIAYTFRGGNDGAFPAARLTDVNGTLFGTTTAGGGLDDGEVFAFTPVMSGWYQNITR